MIEVKLGAQFVGCRDISKSEWEDLAKSKDSATLIRFLDEQAKETVIELRNELSQNHIDKAHRAEGYAQALEDIAHLLESGIEEGLKESESKS